MSQFWEILPPIFIFGFFTLMLKWYFEYRTRKQLIEKGLVDEKTRYLQFEKAEWYVPSSLKWGLVFVFVGVALIALRVASAYVPDEVVLGAVLIAAGLGLLVYYAIAAVAMKRRNREHDHPQE